MNSADWLHLAGDQGLAALERAVNRALELDPAGAAGLSALSGSSFDFTCIAPHTTFRLRLSVQDSSLHITRRAALARSDAEESGDLPAASLEGPVNAYWQLLVAEDSAAELINGPLTVGGDSRAIETLRQALSGLEPDWEQPLAEAIGDIPAHRIGRTLRRLWQNGSGLRSDLLKQLRRFISQPSDPRPVAPESAFAEFALLRQSARRAIASWTSPKGHSITNASSRRREGEEF